MKSYLIKFVVLTAAIFTGCEKSTIDVENATGTQAAQDSDFNLVLEAPDTITTQEGLPIKWSQIKNVTKYTVVIGTDKDCENKQLSVETTDVETKVDWFVPGTYYVCVIALLKNGKEISNSKKFRVTGDSSEDDDDDSDDNGSDNSDTVAPTITQITSSTADGTYKAGDSIALAVTFSEAVTVTGGTPHIVLSTSGTATYTSGSGTTALVFTYAVGASQNSSDLDVNSASSDIVLNGATIRDAAGNDADPTLPVTPAATSLAVLKALVIDTQGPSVTNVYSDNSAAATYIAAQVITIKVVYDEAVNIAGGTPTLKLETGSTDANATYVTGSGTTTLEFQYTVAASQTTTDLDVHDSADQISLNAATMTDTVGNNADRDLPTGLEGGALAINEALVVDTLAPTVGTPFISMTAVEYVDNEIKLSWTASSDAVTAAGSLVYEVFHSASANIDTLANIVLNGTSVGTQTGTTTKTITTLTVNALYYFAVTVTDAAGNKAMYTMRKPFCGGDGTAGTPYQVCDAGSLQYVSIAPTVNFIQTADVDLSDSTNWNGGKGFRPIGELPAGDVHFTGIYDGANYKISNMTINDGAQILAGLFRSISGATTVIKRVNVRNADIYADYQIGALTGWVTTDATIEDSSVTGEIRCACSHATDSQIGGFVGEAADGLIRRSWADVDVLVGDRYVGGFAGRVINGLIVEDSYSLSNARSTGNFLGGFAGSMTGIVRRSYAKGAVSGGSSANYVGGFIGGIPNSGAPQVDNCYFEGTVQGFGRTGGFIGEMTANAVGRTINNSYAIARVWNTAAAQQSGGFIGTLITGTINDSFAIGSVSSPGTLGAFAGAISANGVINDSYYFSHQTPTACFGTNAGTVNGCTAKTNMMHFYNKANEPLASWSWGATDSWFIDQDSMLPRLRAIETANDPISFGKYFKANRKVGHSDASAYNVWGYCGTSAAAISFTGTANNPANTTCSGGVWSTTWDLSGEAEGNITLTATLGATSASRVVVKSTGCSADANGGTVFSGGAGTSGNPYVVCTLAELQDISNYSTSHFVLGDNIDATLTSGWNAGAGFVPLGDSAASYQFTGSFNGQNFVIKNLTINRAANTYVGLFGNLSSNSISNVGLENALIIGKEATGGIAGYMNGGTSISNSYFVGTVTGAEEQVGGLVGSHVSGGLTASVTNSFAIGGITTNKDATPLSQVGGLMGSMSGGANFTLSDSYFHGFVLGHSDYAGGLIGSIASMTNYTIADSHMYGHVHTTTSYSGGIVGYINANNTAGSIERVYSDGHVFCFALYCGGIVGYQADTATTIEDSYSTAGVTGSYTSSASADSGSFIGRNAGTIRTSYATGNQTSAFILGYRSGFVGRNEGTIEDVFATGITFLDVLAPTLVGVIAGNNAAGAVIDDAYWYANAINARCVGTEAGTTSCSSISSLDTFKASASALFDDWDFDTIWQIPAGGGFPVHQ